MVNLSYEKSPALSRKGRGVGMASLVCWEAERPRGNARKPSWYRAPCW